MVGRVGLVLRRMPHRPAVPVGARAWLAACALLVLAGWFAIAAAAAADKPLAVDVAVSRQAGFGRMILTFPGLNIMPGHRLSSDNGIVVITFDKPVDLTTSSIASGLSDYVTIARADPEGRGLRLALKQFVRVNSIDAGPQLFVDFLPREWTGPAPHLPDEVIAELARRADEAAKAAAQAELMKITGGKPARLTVTASRAPTFTRLTFAWNVPFEAEFRRTDFGVSLAFNRSATPDLTALKADLPPFVNDISADATPTGLAVSIAVEPVADVRAFKDDSGYVVDVQGPPNPAALNSVDRTLLAAVGGLPQPDAGATGLVQAAGTGGTTSAAASHEVGAAPSPRAAPAADHGPAAPAADAVGAAAETTMEAPPRAIDTPPAADSAAAAPAPARPDIAELPNNSAIRAVNDGIVRVEAVRVGQSAHLVFPYAAETGAAMFMRDSTVWMVFDDPSPIDSASLQDALVGFARRIERTPLDGGQAIRVELTQPYLMTMSPDGPKWVVTIGEMVADPTRPLSVLRRVGLDGRKSLDIPFGPVSKIRRIVDSSSGEPIIVVTGRGQPRGLVKAQRFTELDMLASMHGVAVMPKVDDLTVGAEGEQVTISRPGGLSVSTVPEQKKATLVDLPKALGASLGRKSGFVDFRDLAVASPPDYWERRHKLMVDLVEARDLHERVDRWYRLATFNLANGFGPEASGILDVISGLAPEEEATSERMAVLRAGADVLAYRPDDAIRMLDAPKFKDSPDASVWRAMAFSDLGKHREAMAEFERGDLVIDAFPSVIQRRYVLAETASAIETGDYDTARDRLAKLDPRSLSDAERARLDVLNALSRDAAGRAADAVALLSEVIRDHDGRAAAEATFRLVQIQRREGLITLDQAIERLEQLTVSWRGDELELKVLRLLGQYSVERGNYRRAFEVMRVAEQIRPESKTAKAMYEEMQAAFASLFLDGAANSMRPVDALALYYDFRELTPSGRRGDAMVRKLANRLVDVDLLDQAAALLSYQVENRLRGAARAQTAADLALVYLLDRRPDKALFTLAKTRQAQLPVAIERQRRMVEAEAMAASGNLDGALELLSPFPGADVQRVSADLLWQADRYVDAGVAYEKLLGGRWSDALPLSQDEQLEVLKAGIAYTFANDRLSVDRLRSKYLAKMAGTANGSAFEAVTGPIVAGGDDFNAVVKSVGAADAMSTFLADYRKRYLNLGTADKPPVSTADPGGTPPAGAAQPSADAGTAAPGAAAG